MDAAPRDLACTCYRLRKASRKVTALYDAELAALGLTVTQLNILAMLSDGQARPMSNLAAALGMDASTLTRTMRPLMSRGAVEAAPGEDRRQRCIRLSDAGRALSAGALKPWRAAQRRVEAALGTDLATLHSLLARLDAALGQARDERAGP